MFLLRVDDTGSVLPVSCIFKHVPVMDSMGLQMVYLPLHDRTQRRDYVVERDALPGHDHQHRRHIVRHREARSRYVGEEHTSSQAGVRNTDTQQSTKTPYSSTHTRTHTHTHTHTLSVSLSISPDVPLACCTATDNRLPLAVNC